MPLPNWAIVGMISILVIVAGVALMRFFQRGTAGVPKGREGAADPFNTGTEKKRMSLGPLVVIAIFLIFIAGAAYSAYQGQFSALPPTGDDRPTPVPSDARALCSRSATPGSSGERPSCTTPSHPWKCSRRRGICVSARCSTVISERTERPSCGDAAGRGPSVWCGIHPTGGRWT